MTDLAPAARYRYSLAGGGENSYPFLSPPARGRGVKFSFVAVGDLGTPGVEDAKSPGAAATLGRVAAE